MEFIKATQLRSNGDLSNEYQLVTHDNTPINGIRISQKRIVQKFPSSVSNLENIYNSIHQLLLEETTQRERDGIVGSRSYGYYHVVSTLFPTIPEYHVIPSENLEELVWWIGAVLSTETTPESSIRSLNRKFYSVARVDYTFLSLRKLCNTLENLEFSNEMNSCEVRYTEKLNQWCSIGNDPWLPTPTKGIHLLVHLANQVKNNIAENTGYEWGYVSDVLSEMQVVHIEYNGEPVFAVSRVSSEMRSVLFMLNCPLPPVVIRSRNAMGVEMVGIKPSISKAKKQKYAA